jgi:GDP-mannose 6-dehydrogenase
MLDSIDAVLHHAQTVVIGNKDPDFQNVLSRLRDDQAVVDLVRIADGVGKSGNYDGICW